MLKFCYHSLWFEDTIFAKEVFGRADIDDSMSFCNLKDIKLKQICNELDR